MPFAKEVLHYLWDVFDLASSQDFDEGIFQCYQSIGRSLSAQEVAHGSTQTLSAKLASTLGQKLDALNPSWQKYSGLRMEQFWMRFRPATASDLSQLDHSLQIRALADQFDALKWRSGASVQQLDILRNSLACVHEAVVSASIQSFEPLDVRKLLRWYGEVNNTRQDILRNVEELDSYSRLKQTSVSPYFQSQFDMLCQYGIFAGADESSEDTSVIDLLAGRPTVRLMKFGSNSAAWETLSRLQDMTSLGQQFSELAAARGTLHASLLKKLKHSSEVSLRSLGLLHFEMDVLARSVAKINIGSSTCPTLALEEALRILAQEVKEAIQINDNSPEFEHLKRLSARLSHRFSGESPNQFTVSSKTNHLHECLRSVIEARFFESAKLANQANDEFERLSMKCVQFFTGCLLLYVPDRLFDPAIRPMVERSRHHRRKAELEVKLQALHNVNMVFTGRTSSLRADLLTERLEALGKEPAIPSIVRPRTSELDQLQVEFNNILTTVVLRSPTLSMLRAVIQGELSTIEEVRLLKLNITQAIDRLSHSYRAYEDITMPLIALLNGLDMGIAFALLATSQPTSGDHTIRHLCGTTPFFGAQLDDLLKQTHDKIMMQHTNSFEPRFHFLEGMVVIRSVEKDLELPSTQTMFQTFHSFYENWKQRLGSDQRENAANSSLYRYRGNAEDTDEDNLPDFHQLFPDYSASSDDHIRQGMIEQEPKAQACRLAKLHQRIFQIVQGVHHGLLGMVRDASLIIAEIWHDDSATSKFPVPNENLFSAVILSLDESVQSLSGQFRQDQLYNFYADANLPEVEKVISLVQRIQTRFADLQETWPEHATIGDVLQTSSQLLALRHTEPLAKLLTKAEQLHGFVYEWQLVASREFTAAILYDQLTDLLVSWRRLELSTWARLLDMEDEKCKDDADSWWFIAYEIMIAVPLSMASKHEDLRLHAVGMFSSLADFLSTTSIGQYCHRLEMIDCFRIHLELLLIDIPPLNVIHNGLVNFLRYYRSFDGPIQESLRKGRQTLEKAIKEEILLASWKDTNINALRESAKRSHHKLFKFVRKYRTLLAEASETILAQGLPEKAHSSKLILRDVLYANAALDLPALQVCEQRIAGWTTKSERHKNPNSTSTRMVKMSQLPPGAIDAASYVSSFGANLTKCIKNLQGETPVKLTKENKEAIKHLKTRKRKLYAETLKDLRHMGFGSNLSADALEKQASASVILTNTPALPEILGADARDAEHYFHKLLNLLPQVKDRARDHSEDLTHHEVNKSIGYLESIVSLLLRQRTVIANANTDYDRFDIMLNQIQNMWAPDSYDSELQNNKVHMDEVHRTLRWLPGILKAACIIIEKFTRLAGTAASNVIEDLAHWGDRISKILRAIDDLPTLPTNVTSSRHVETLSKAEGMLRELKIHLHQCLEKTPDLRLIITQIELWTNVRALDPKNQGNGEQLLTPDDFDQRVSVILDSVLVAIQRMQGTYASVPTTVEDTAWLFGIEHCFATSLKSSGAKEINDLLEATLENITRLRNNDGVGVAAAVYAMAMPILGQYRIIQQAALARHLEFHASLCRLASILAQSFSHIIREGFCSPQEASSAENEGTEKLEGGTGLGEGEGAEDISKDVQDDEDLTEVAQGGREKEKEGIDDQENAVNMDHDELEGEIGDVSDEDEEGDPTDDFEENDLEEEAGSLDELDPKAVDEKLWDGKSEEAQKEKEGSNAKGKAESNKQQAGHSTDSQNNARDQGDDDDEEVSQEGVEEGEEVTKEESGKMDSHTQDGQTLDLPEEMNLDNVDDTEPDLSDGDIGDVSDIDQAQGIDETNDQEVDGGQDGENERRPFSPRDETDQEQDAAADDAEEAESLVNTEPEEEHTADEQGPLRDISDAAAVANENNAPSDVRGSGEDTEQQRNDEEPRESQAQASKGTKGTFTNHQDSEAVAENGQNGPTLDSSEQAQAKDDVPLERSSSKAFQKLGDALERWHRRQKQIQNAAEQQQEVQTQTADVDMANKEFEHLADEDAEADTQALGTSTNEQARALEESTMESEINSQRKDFPTRAPEDEVMNAQGASLEEFDSQMKREGQGEQSRPRTFIADDANRSRKWNPSDPQSGRYEEDIDNLDNGLSITHLQPIGDHLSRSIEQARRLWSHYDSITRDLSQSLTEQLRLILAPTLATKMRGDFRTGKRLNIKRMIPYIASQYKRDKIWMRRSIPSKRNYQIMLAVDDSKSMGESGSGQLAFETLALVVKSLTMLEVGEVAVVSFGNEVNVAHDFDRAFSPEAGAQIFQHFTFQQTGTNVRKLVANSITLFREARRKNSSSGTDLWQLELIISDGVCEDHEAIRRLVRQAQEERILILFVIIDALTKGQSIMDMSQAVFEPDGAGVKIKRYLDDFPFPYYLVVGDVRHLPGVLAQALRQWFSEVVESG